MSPYLANKGTAAARAADWHVSDNKRKMRTVYGLFRLLVLAFLEVLRTFREWFFWLRRMMTAWYSAGFFVFVFRDQTFLLNKSRFQYTRFGWEFKKQTNKQTKRFSFSSLSERHSQGRQQEGKKLLHYYSCSNSLLPLLSSAYWFDATDHKNPSLISLTVSVVVKHHVYFLPQKQCLQWQKLDYPQQEFTEAYFPYCSFCFKNGFIVYSRLASVIAGTTSLHFVTSIVWSVIKLEYFYTLHKEPVRRRSDSGSARLSLQKLCTSVDTVLWPWPSQY